MTSIPLPSKGVCLAISGGKRLKNTECTDTQNVETGWSYTSYKAAVGCINGAILTCNIILSEATEASSSTPAFPSTVTTPRPPPSPALTSVGTMHTGDGGGGGGGELKALGLSGDGELLACAYTHKTIHLYKAGVA